MAGIQSCCSCMQSPLTALTQNTIMWSMGPCRFRLLPPQGCFPVAISIYSLYKSSSFFSILLFLLPRIFTPEPHPSFWPAAAYLFSKSHFSHSHCVWHLSQPLFLMMAIISVQTDFMCIKMYFIFITQLKSHLIYCSVTYSMHLIFKTIPQWIALLITINYSASWLMSYFREVIGA